MGDRPAITLLATGFALALLAAACSSSSGTESSATIEDGAAAEADAVGPDTATADEADPSGSGASATIENGAESRVDPSTEPVHVAFLVPDFGPLADTGLVPDVGDPRAQVESHVDYVNSQGGLAGHPVIATYHDFDPTGGETSRTSCLEATQDADADVVIGLPGALASQVRCVTVANETLMVSQVRTTPTMVEESEGRAFSVGMDFVRLFRAWAEILDERGLLEGATVGVVTGELGPEYEEAVDDGLLPALADLGITPEVVRLPCATVACEQHDVAVERLEASGVDLVLNALAPFASSTFATVADGGGYQPQMSVVGDSTADSVATFYEAASETMAGATGLAELEEPESTPLGDECNDRYAKASGARHEPGTDAYGFTAISCAMVDLVVRAAQRADSADPADLIAALEREDDGGYSAERPWTFAPGKHDGSDWVLLRTFDPSTLEWRADPGEDWQKVDAAA